MCSGFSRLFDLIVFRAVRANRLKYLLAPGAFPRRQPSTARAGQGEFGAGGLTRARPTAVRWAKWPHAHMCMLCPSFSTAAATATVRKTIAAGRGAAGWVAGIFGCVIIQAGTLTCFAWLLLVFAGALANTHTVMFANFQTILYFGWVLQQQQHKNVHSTRMMVQLNARERAHTRTHSHTLRWGIYGFQ